jgi:lysyl-tRNA synthetase class 1
MTERIIGYGTWYDKTALEVIERERRLSRSLDLIRTEMGFGASGIPHVGNVSDAIRSYAMTVALQAQNYSSELIAFCDDKDGLRKVPAGFPQSLKRFLGFPVTAIPDPFKCHESFGEHSSSLLLEAFDRCGVKYTFTSAADVYRRGLLNREIETILSNAGRVGEIIKEEVGQEKFEEALPYFAICGNCGRIYTTRTYEYLPKEKKVLYSCEGMKIKGQRFEGCGHKGEANYIKGEGKLVWKVEFAARWKALDIRYEAYGKDIADSVRVNDHICREILDWEPPLHAKYELFLDKSGKRMSKSAGVVFTPQTWFTYGSPQSLIYAYDNAPDPGTWRTQSFVVLVTDSAGKPVRNGSLTIAAPSSPYIKLMEGATEKASPLSARRDSTSLVNAFCLSAMPSLQTTESVAGRYG